MRKAIGRLTRSEPTVLFARFVAVGIINTAFGYAVYAACILGGMAPQPALIFSFALGIVWNFFTTARLVFKHQGFRRFPVYVLCYLLVYGLNAGGLHIALSMGFSALLAQALLMPFAAVLAFLLISIALTGRLPGAPRKLDEHSRAE